MVFFVRHISLFIHITCTMLLASLLVGCFGSVKSEYYSTVLPTYDFDTNAPTIIVADPWDLSSKYYAGIALEHFKKRGFNNIYLQGQIDQSFARNVIYVKVGKERLDPSTNYQYKFNASGVCNVINGVPSCVIDTSNSDTSKKTIKRTVMDVYKVTFDWYDVYKKARILYVAGSSTVDAQKHTDLEVVNSLIGNTIKRMEFKRPVQYVYNGSVSSK